MPEIIAKLAPTGPKPEVELTIGEEKRGKYVVELFDPTSTKSK